MEIDFEGKWRSLAQIFRTLMRELHALSSRLLAQPYCLIQ